MPIARGSASALKIRSHLSKRWCSTFLLMSMVLTGRLVHSHRSPAHLLDETETLTKIQSVRLPAGSALLSSRAASRDGTLRLRAEKQIGGKDATHSVADEARRS